MIDKYNFAVRDGKIELEGRPEKDVTIQRPDVRSKYDPIIDAFLESEHNLVTAEAEGKEANYLRTQLKKRIDARDLQDKIEVSVVNNTAYLEK